MYQLEEKRFDLESAGVGIVELDAECTVVKGQMA